MKVANSSINVKDLAPIMEEYISDIEKLLGYEITITSGYRSPEHPIEAAKSRPGEHTTGLAIDVAAIGGPAVYALVTAAIAVGCERIGISRKSNFVHLGFDKSRVTSIWTY